MGLRQVVQRLGVGEQDFGVADQREGLLNRAGVAARTRIARVDVLVAGVSRQVVDVGHARLVFAGIGAVVVLDDLVPHLFRGRRLHLPQGARETDARVEPRLAVVIGLVSAAGQGVVLR